MTRHELAILHEALESSSRVLSEGHERAPRLTTAMFKNALPQMDVIAHEPLGSSARQLAAVLAPSCDEVAPRERGPITDPADPSVPEEIKVFFEGKWCRWSDLTLQDRKAYMLGGFPY